MVRYVGMYPFGSAGNDDTQFMYAMAQAGVAVFRPYAGRFFGLAALAVYPKGVLDSLGETSILVVGKGNAP